MKKSQESPIYQLAQQYYKSLKATEKVSRERLIEHQRDVATTMLQHVEEFVPFYRVRLAPISRGDGSYDFDRWHEVPILTKEELKKHYQELKADEFLPKEHGRLTHSESSATTGTPIRIPKSQLTELANACNSYRHIDAHDMDTSANLVMIRAMRNLPRERPQDEAAQPNSEATRWGKPWTDPEKRGKRRYMSINQHPSKQLELLQEMAPSYVNTMPSNAVNLARYVAANDIEPPEIRAILSVGETVTEQMREEVKKHLKCKMIDVYSTSECGNLASECAISGGYHIQSELAIVEVINDAGEPCKIGEAGKVVATPLFNLAMPLIRFRFDDYVTLAPPCPCGRPQPLIGAIHGRQNGLMHLSSASRGYPPIDLDEMRRYLGNCRWQLVQIQKNLAELRYMQTPEEEKVNESEAKAYLQRLLGRDIKISCRQVPAIGPSPGGKFLRIKNEIG